MVAEHIPISHARARLLRLAEELAADPSRDAIALTKHGQPLLALMPWDLYQTVTETLEILSDPDEIERFRSGLQDLKDNCSLPWEEAKAELDI
jgi:antitoxin YefM